MSIIKEIAKHIPEVRRLTKKSKLPEREQSSNTRHKIETLKRWGIL